MHFESVIDAIFSSRPDLDELLFDGFATCAEVSGESKAYRPSPIASFRLSELQDFALAQGVRWDPMQPAAGGTFSREDRHYRWHGLLPPVARDGLLLSIRRHRLGEFRLDDFFPSGVGEQILSRLNQDHPVLVMGETGAGKTSFMISALLHLAADERVAILEHLPEVPRLSERWIRLCAQSPNVSGEGSVSLSYLIDELLRLRPDRMIIGELRREELGAYRRALLAGHGSVWTTIHASSAMELPWRLAELGAGSVEEWSELLKRKQAYVVCLKRKSPRFQGLFQFTDTGIISCF